jgi:hypothetical protein
LKITPSLENSPKSQEVAGHRKQKIEPTLSLLHVAQCPHPPPAVTTTVTTTVTTASVRPLEARAQIMMADDVDYFLPSVVFPQPQYAKVS